MIAIETTSMTHADSISFNGIKQVGYTNHNDMLSIGGYAYKYYTGEVVAASPTQLAEAAKPLAADATASPTQPEVATSPTQPEVAASPANLTEPAPLSERQKRVNDINESIIIINDLILKLGTDSPLLRVEDFQNQVNKAKSAVHLVVIDYINVVTSVDAYTSYHGQAKKNAIEAHASVSNIINTIDEIQPSRTEIEIKRVTRFILNILTGITDYKNGAIESIFAANNATSNLQKQLLQTQPQNVALKALYEILLVTIDAIDLDSPDIIKSMELFCKQADEFVINAETSDTTIQDAAHQVKSTAHTLLSSVIKYLVSIQPQGGGIFDIFADPIAKLSSAMADLKSSTDKIQALADVLDTKVNNLLTRVSATNILTNNAVDYYQKHFEYKQRLDSANKEYTRLNKKGRTTLQGVNSTNTTNCKKLLPRLLEIKTGYENISVETKTHISDLVPKSKTTDDVRKALQNLDKHIQNVIGRIHSTHTHISKTCDMDAKSFINTMQQVLPLDNEEAWIKVENLLEGNPPVPTRAQPEPIVKQLSTPTPVPVPKKTRSSTSDMPNEYLIMYLFEMIGLLLSKDNTNVDFQNAIQKHVTFEPHAAIPTAIFESIKGIKGSTSQQPLDKSSRMALSYLVIQHVKRNR